MRFWGEFDELSLIGPLTPDEERQIDLARSQGGRGYWDYPQSVKDRLKQLSDLGELQVIRADKRALEQHEGRDGGTEAELTSHPAEQAAPTPAPFDPWA